VNYLEPPAGYEPVNKKTAEGFMMGAQLRSTPGKSDSAWVRGRQLAFLLDLPGEPRSRQLELSLHLPEWMPEQAFTLRLNHGQPVRSARLGQGSEGFWQTTRLELPLADQRPGTNFVSVVFDHSWPNPDADDWFASTLLQFLRVSEPQDNGLQE
jgi:hypothetical protein